jgi:hypothetical protein
MVASEKRKRQHNLLREIASRVDFRTDGVVILQTINCSLIAKDQFRKGEGEVGTKDFDKDPGCDDAAYDLNALVSRGFIELDYMTKESSAAGRMKQSDPIIRITESGLERVEQLEAEEREQKRKRWSTIGWFIYTPVVALVIYFVAPALTPLITDWMKAKLPSSQNPAPTSQQ